MRTIHQFHFTASPRDAVTNHMRFLQGMLREGGVGGKIFACDVKTEGVESFDARRIGDGDLLLLHHSHGNPALDEVLATAIPKALVYHNITPGEFFPHDLMLARLSEIGRAQLFRLLDAVGAAFADSRYNRRELESFGFRGVKLLPLFHLPESVPTSPRVAACSGNILFVGKLTPHKDQALLIRTFFYLSRLGDFRLVLVGGEDPVYGDYLKLLARALGVEDRVRFMGKISDEKREICYREAAAFVSVSRHEGFGIPLVEAMQRGVPVFARDGGAIRETLGGAGVRLLTDKPHRIAEVIAATLGNAGALAAILEGQAERLASLRKEQNRARVIELLLPRSSRKISPARENEAIL